MSQEIVQRLRGAADYRREFGPIEAIDIYVQAADEIERLRVELQEVKDDRSGREVSGETPGFTRASRPARSSAESRLHADAAITRLVHGCAPTRLADAIAAQREIHTALSGLIEACELWASDDLGAPHLPRRVIAALVPAKRAVRRGDAR